ncbi:unnamed protein product [Coffea canephora]|uniref:DH200=94 genomic scaffold, scaffold_109 n=2 Tax=Coffea TaxID=13442 RepID=A0A068V564_COFCA|nr:receptor-like protein kinase FERONIA [Coffea arabica]CDP15786.1 unnamed protein product [Coffea canephora]
MFTLLVYLSFHFSLLFTITSSDTPPYTPTDYILINCGSSSNATSTDGRHWEGDVGSKFLPNDVANISLADTATEQHSSVTQIPFLTARIIRSQFSYTFPVSPGEKFLRLYFYPSSYSSGLNTSESFFTVTANNYTLLSNFNAFLIVSAKKFAPASLIKEFIINVQGMNQFLKVNFLPSMNSYAFVNGIEVVSTPDDLYMGNHDMYANPLKFVNCPNVQFEFDQNKTAFEALYRLNVGGNDVSPVYDSGMFREWASDDKFIWGGDRGNPLSNNEIAIKYTPQTPNYAAPPIVYATARAMGQFSTSFNLSWIFPVDSGFLYLLRLHFCEINPDLITKENQRVFTIFINNRTAEPEADIIYWAHDPGISIFRDYIVYVSNPPDGRRNKQDLFLALHPNLDVKPKYADAILNGLELFKLNSSEGNLAGTNPGIAVDPNSLVSNTKSPNKGSSGKFRVSIAIVGGVAGGAAMALTIGFRTRLLSRRVILQFPAMHTWMSGTCIEFLINGPTTLLNYMFPNHG